VPDHKYRRHHKSAATCIYMKVKSFRFYGEAHGRFAQRLATKPRFTIRPTLFTLAPMPRQRPEEPLKCLDRLWLGPGPGTSATSLYGNGFMVVGNG